VYMVVPEAIQRYEKQPYTNNAPVGSSSGPSMSASFVHDAGGGARVKSCNTMRAGTTPHFVQADSIVPGEVQGYDR
jgi:hypothetical protein